MSIDPSKVTACLVTRGNVDMQPILDSLIFDEVIVWDNSKRDHDAKAYGRFLAMREARNEVCYFQDDDAIIPPETQLALCLAYEDGQLLANHDADHAAQEWAWFGWGSLVHRELVEVAHDRWRARYGEDDAFLATGCDIVAGTLIPHRIVTLPFRHLDYAFGADRLCQTSEYPDWKNLSRLRALALLEET